MKETKNLLSNGALAGKHLNFKPKCLSRPDSKRAGLANLFQTMPLSLCPRPMTPPQAPPQVKLKHSFGRSGWRSQELIIYMCKQTSFPPRNVTSMKHRYIDHYNAHREQSPICGV